MAPCGVAVTGSSPRPDGCLPVRASLRRGRVQVWLRAVWRRPASLGIFVGARLPPPRASPSAAPRGVAAADTPLCSGENDFAFLPSSRASPEWLRAERRRSTFAGALLPSSRASPKGSAWCGGGRPPPHGWVFGGFGNGSGRKLSSNFFEPATRFSFLKASLKSLAITSHRHMAREKSLPSSGLDDDDYVTASFTSLEASSKSSYVLM